jgi:hypothetical protein
VCVRVWLNRGGGLFPCSFVWASVFIAHPRGSPSQMEELLALIDEHLPAAVAVEADADAEPEPEAAAAASRKSKGDKSGGGDGEKREKKEKKYKKEKPEKEKKSRNSAAAAGGAGMAEDASGAGGGRLAGFVQEEHVWEDPGGGGAFGMADDHGGDE